MRQIDALEGLAQPLSYAQSSAIDRGLRSATQLCQALVGLAEEDPLRPRLARVSARLGAAHRTFRALAERVG